MSGLTKKRLIKDITDIYHSPLHDQGIYYLHDEENMLRGYALIKGPADTPYEHGFYTFQFDFPEDYPHTPPKVTFTTGDGKMRFNPNLYVEGKVCLSILNTWEGEKWTSCQTIRSVLLTLITLFNENPMNNEPAYIDVSKTHKSCQNYNAVVAYKNIDVALLNYFENGIPEKYNHFREHIITHIIENKEKIDEKLKKWKINGYKSIPDGFVYKEGMLIGTPYRYECLMKYSNLYIRLQMVLKNLQ
jgi:ubiquitin-protein ligase